MRKLASSLAATLLSFHAAHAQYACPSTAATFYVARDGNDSNPGNSIAQAFATIGKGISMLSAGQILQVEPGTYGSFVVAGNMGTTSEPIIMRGDQNYPRGRVIIDGGIWISEPWWIVCHMRETRNKTAAGVGVQGQSNVTVIDMEIDHNFKGGFWAHSGSGIIIANSYLHDNVLENENDRQGDSGNWDQGIGLYNVANSTVSGNYVQDNWGEGIDVFADASFTATGNNLVIGNTVQNSFSVALYNDGVSDDTWNANFAYSNSRAYNRDGEPMQGLTIADENAIWPGSSGVVMTNNITRNVVNGFTYGSYGQALGLRNVLIGFNTFANSEQLGVRIDAASGTTGDTFVDNIFVTSTDAAAYIPGGQSGLMFTHNLWYGALFGLPTGGDQIEADPEFVGDALSSPKFVSVRKGSPALGAGTQVAGITIDFLGLTRNPVAPTIGAIENPWP